MNPKEKRSKRERDKCSTDRVKSIIRHIEKQNVYYSASTCAYHFNRACFTLLNNFNSERFHCLFANHAMQWRSYSITKSCDIPESFYDLMVLNKILGDNYVVPFAGHFKESSGYTIGMFQQSIGLYPPHIINQSKFAETVFTMIVFFVAVCHRMGGNTPNMKYLSFLYTEYHPVLCDIGSFNVENRERLDYRSEHFNKKKWKRFLLRKTNRSIIQHLKIYFPNFFQKKRTNKKCILNESEEAFPEEAHRLICGSEKKPLLNIIKEFRHLMTDERIAYGLLSDWVQSVEEDCFEIPDNLDI